MPRWHLSFLWPVLVPVSLIVTPARATPAFVTFPEIVNAGTAVKLAAV